MTDMRERPESRASYQVLLAAMLGVFALQPFLREDSLLIRMWYASIPLGATLAVFRQRRLFLTGLAIALAAIGARLVDAGTDTTLELVLALVAYGYAIVVFLALILSHRVVTGSTVAGALCIYLLLGILWTFAYLLVERLAPGSFAGLREDPRNDFLYLSFVTLTTLGYGDVTPLSDAARHLAMLEAVTGQLYLVTMVARMVGVARL